jgi:D-arabinose 1-dehydrogenase-like Zn-dependent alcohol dehydrogenase
MDLRCAHRWAFAAFGGALAERTDALNAVSGDEATVRVTHCGICHSDLHFVAGGFDLGNGQKTSITRAGATLPLTMGHEIAGELVELGPAAIGAPVPIGGRVVVYPWIGCGACSACERGDDHLCTKVSRNLGLQLPGGYADLVRVPHARYLVPIGTLDPARAATLACAGITAMGAIGKLGPIEPGQRVVVVGCGGVGMTAVALLKATTAAQAIAIDADAAKRAAALSYGAAAAHDPAEPDVVRTIQKANGFDIAAVLDFVGSESSAALAVALVRRTGHVVIVGLFGGEFRMPLPMFALRSLRITGSYVGSLADLKELVALAQRVSLPPTPLHLRPLAQVNEALADMAAGRFVGRTVLQP